MTLPAKRPCDHAYVLKIQGRDLQPAPLPPPPGIGPEVGGKFILRASDANIHGDTPQYEKGGDKDQIGHWADPQDYVSWDLQVTPAGSYDVTITYSCQPGAEGSRFTVEVAGQKLTADSKPTQSWSTYRTESLGKITFEKPGSYALAVKPSADPKWRVIGLKDITLSPVR